MAWQVEFEEAALKDLAKLDKQVARRIIAFLRERVSNDPRSVGEALKGSKLGAFWKYLALETTGSSPASRTAARCESWWCGLVTGGRCIGDQTRRSLD